MPWLRRIWPWGLGLVALSPGLFSEKGDTVLYASYAQQALAGRHFFTQIAMEYPPLNALLFVLPAYLAYLIPGIAYYGAFLLLAGTADLLQRRALLRMTSSPRQGLDMAWVSAACAAMLFYMYLKRFDIFAAATTTWMLTRLLRQPHDLGAWVLWGLAASCKLYPLTFAPLCLAYSYYQCTPWRRLAQQILVGACIIVAIQGFASWYGGPGAFAWLVYMRQRGLQLASVYTAIGILIEGIGKPLPVAYQFGCIQVYAPWAAWCVGASVWLTLAALGLTWGLSWRHVKSAHGLWRGAAACVVALLLTSKVLSPQYVIWLVPLLCTAAALPDTDGILMALTLGLCASTAFLFPYEMEVGQGMVFRQSMLLARSALLLMTWGWLCWPSKPQRAASLSPRSLDATTQSDAL